MTFASAERAKLVSLLHQLGPDAPTLCEGWATRDLVAHLWVRQNQPMAAAGMFVTALAGYLDKSMSVASARDFDELVDDWGRGASKLNVMRYLDSQVNFVEHFVHHEDVRRANGQEEPREFSRSTTDAMYKSLKLLAPRMLSKSRQPVALFAEGYPRIIVGDTPGVSTDGSAVVRVMGEVGELILWVYGRDVARVQIEGDPTAVVRSSI